MSFLDTLFGSDPSVEQMSRLTGGQQNVLDLLTKVLGGQVGQGIEGYGGPLVAGESPLQSLIFGKSEDWLNRMGEGGKEYWEKSIKEPMMENWKSEILPNIREQFVGQGLQSSSGLNRAITESGRKLQGDLTGTLADVLYKSQENLPANLATMLGIGGTQRGIEQEIVREPYQKWQMTQPWANPWLNQMQLALGTNPYESVVTPGSTGLMDTLMQAGGTAAGGYLGNPNK